VNDILRTVDGRPTLRMERVLAHPPELVWRALIDPAELSQWFPATVKMDLAVGATISFDMGDGIPMSGRIIELDPPRVLAFSWNTDVLRFELLPHESGCRLVFTHTFDDRYGAASFASGWHMCLDAMQLLLAGKPLEESPPSAELHDRYVRQFGLDAGVVESTDDGWMVRFERQLTRPTAEVWSLLSDGTPPGSAEVVAGGKVPDGFVAHHVRAQEISAARVGEYLEYSWLPADPDARDALGTVRWTFTTGTGHGARLIVTQSGPDDQFNELAAALDGWRLHIDRLAAQLRHQ